jgi:hypothetical protein
MATLKIFKETALPGSLEPNAIYLVGPAGQPNVVEMYVTNAAGTATRKIITAADVQAQINASLASISELKIVADIAARNALTPTSSVFVYVQNATADNTVTSGGATYLYNPTNTSWIKTSESESMDIALSWSALTGKPSSSVAAIDAAVSNSHTHPNKTQLDMIGQNGAGELTYNGQQVKTSFETVNW